MQPDLIKTFRAEASELLAELETALLELENDPTNSDGIGRVFRAMHTIKGSSGMAGFAEIVRFTHDVETLLDRVRKGQVAINQEILSLTLSAKDHVQTLLGDPEADQEWIATSDQILARLRPLLNEANVEKSPADRAKSSGLLATYWIRYRPPPETLATGSNPLALLEELEHLGMISQTFHGEAIPVLEDMLPDQTYGWWDILLSTERGESGIRDIFMFEDERSLRISRLGDGSVRKGDFADMSTLFAPGGPNTEEALLAALHGHYQRILNEKVQKRRECTGKEDTTLSSIRVDSERLDRLVDMVGELVIIQSRLSLLVHRKRDSALEQIGEELERLTTEMRSNALGMRMVPIGTSFNSFRRLVRDLSATLGKQVDLVTEGEDTELDKTVIDRLKDPLLHILRNSIDHGIESPEARTRSGKAEKGTVRLAASNASGDVILTISDDGNGIDPDKIRRKAVERGLIAADAELAKRELLNLIFEAGFSTAEKVTDVSGRGVGMDVVKKAIDALRGTVDLDSTPGQGTIFTIRLPLTLAIIDGLNVQVGKESFILPLATVEACQERFLDGSEKAVGSIERMGHLIPCISLRHLMQVPGDAPRYERVIIAKVDNMEVGMAVDRVVGRQQAVIKSLGGIYKDIEWISGTTINGDGGVSLILDVSQLVRYAANRWEKSGLHPDSMRRRH
ncbi:MAG: chemotaxis protein CheA [Magnetococcales bacterium]|nr:chemotaxis protein CheA [Magnetococcales bacterium]